MPTDLTGDNTTDFDRLDAMARNGNFNSNPEIAAKQGRVSVETYTAWLRRNALKEFTGLLEGQQDKARNAFSTALEVQKARQLGSIHRGSEQQLRRGGLGVESGMIAAAGILAAETQLGGMVVQAEANFDADFARIIQAQAAGFVQGEFQFYHEIALQNLQHELDMKLMRAQAELQADAQRQQAWQSALTVIGTGLGYYAAGPIGGMLGGAAFNPNTYTGPSLYGRG